MMKGVCIAIILVSLLPAAARAEGARLGAAMAAEAGARASDVFPGQNKTGPYALAWKNIRADGVVVVVDGETLPAGAYTLDPAKGAISFRTRVKPESVVRVDYGYDPARAERNNHLLAKPVTVPLLDTRGALGDARMEVTALPGDPKKAGGDTPLLVWGLRGKTDLLGGALSSQLLLAPGSEGGAFADRAGVDLGYRFKTDNTSLEASFLRSGKGFAPGAGKTFGLAEQAQRWSLGAQTSPAGWLAAELRLGGARDLAGKGASDQTALSLRLFGTGAAPALRLARAEDTRYAADGAPTSVTTEKVDLTGKSGLTTYAAQGRRVVSDGSAPGSDHTRQDASLSLSAATRNKKARASVAIRGESVERAGAGAQNNRGIAANAELRPFQDTQVNGSVKIDEGSDTRVTDENVGLTGRLGAAGTYAARGQRVTTDSSLFEKDQTRQDASVSLSAATRNKTARASIAVSGGTTETAARSEARQGIEVRVQPAPSLTLSAEARPQTVTPVQGGVGAEQSLHQAANAEVKLFKDTRLTGSLKINEQEEGRSSVADVNAEAKPLRFLFLAGGMTNRDDTGEDLLDTTRVRMTLRPTAELSFTGGITLNPENEGKVADATRQEFGLAARVGALELGGDYALTTFAPAALSDRGDGAQAGELSLQLGLRFSRFTRLTSGYKDALYGAPEGRATRAYSLGLSHNVGSAVNLSLSGSMTEDKAQIGAPAEVKAEGKLGVKF